MIVVKWSNALFVVLFIMLKRLCTTNTITASFSTSPISSNLEILELDLSSLPEGGQYFLEVLSETSGKVCDALFSRENSHIACSFDRNIDSGLFYVTVYSHDMRDIVIQTVVKYQPKQQLKQMNNLLNPLRQTIFITGGMITAGGLCRTALKHVDYQSVMTKFRPPKKLQKLWMERRSFKKEDGQFDKPVKPRSVVFKTAHVKSLPLNRSHWKRHRWIASVPIMIPMTAAFIIGSRNPSVFMQPPIKTNQVVVTVKEQTKQRVVTKTDNPRPLIRSDGPFKKMTLDPSMLLDTKDLLNSKVFWRTALVIAIQTAKFITARAGLIDRTYYQPHAGAYEYYSPLV